MQARILHHLFRCVSSDVIKAPLWDVSNQGATAFPNNVAYVQQQVSQLLATSFPNMQPQQVEASVALLPPAPPPRPLISSLQDRGVWWGRQLGADSFMTGLMQAQLFLDTCDWAQIVFGCEDSL